MILHAYLFITESIGPLVQLEHFYLRLFWNPVNQYPQHRNSGSPALSLFKFQHTTQHVPASIYYYDHYFIFILHFLYFVIFVPNFLTIFIVVLSDISVNPSSIRSFLDLLSSQYLQRLLILLIQPSHSVSYISSIVTNIRDISDIHSSTASFSSPQSNHIPAININSSFALALSAVVPTLPYIPRSISSISKSPTPEKWTLALSEEIKSLISQKVFDTSPIDITTTQIVPS